MHLENVGSETQLVENHFFFEYRHFEYRQFLLGFFLSTWMEYIHGYQ